MYLPKNTNVIYAPIENSIRWNEGNMHKYDRQQPRNDSNDNNDNNDKKQQQMNERH